MSAALGSLLTALFTTTFATTASNDAAVIFAVLLAFISLCTFCLFTLLKGPQEKDEKTSPKPLLQALNSNKKRSISPTGTATGQVVPVSKNVRPRKPTSSPDIQPPGPSTPPLKPTVSPGLHSSIPSKQIGRRGTNSVSSSSTASNNLLAPPDEDEPSILVPNQNMPLPAPRSREKATDAPYPIVIPTEVISRTPNTLNIMPTVTPELPPMFEDDELYQLPQAGHSFFFSVKSNDMMENYEDACSISEATFRFALADGVSSSAFVRPWARLLCQQWIKQPLTTNTIEAFDNWLIEPRYQWRNWIQTTWHRKINERNRSLGRPQITSEDIAKFIAKGAHATFLGVLLDQKQATWLAFAMGDTCLFHLYQDPSGHWDYKSFPLKTADAFSDAPPTITSRNHTTHLMAKYMRMEHGPYATGDILLLATDALAEWLFKQLEQQKITSVIRLLYTLTNETFAQFVDQERTQRRMKDDDTSLVIIQFK